MKPPRQPERTEYKHLREQAALPGRGGISRIWAALWNTVGGLREGLGTEAAIKQEVAIAFIAVPLSFLIATNLWIWVALIGSLLFLLAVHLHLLHLHLRLGLGRIGLRRLRWFTLQ